MQPIKDLFINGQWHAGAGREFNSVDPAHLAIIARHHAASNEQVQEAIEAARASLPKWKGLSFEARLSYLEAYTKKLTDRHEDLTVGLAQNTGKPLWEAKMEIDSMIAKLAISKEAYLDRCKELSKDLPGFTSKTRHKPHGVVCVLAPFNFPGHLPNGHIIPALLAGNTVILKPSELTAYFAIKMVECWQEADLPPGVLNLVLGFGDVGEALVSNRYIDGVFFTGSFATGSKIASRSLEFPKRIAASRALQIPCWQPDRHNNPQHNMR